MVTIILVFAFDTCHLYGWTWNGTDEAYGGRINVVCFFFLIFSECKVAHVVMILNVVAFASWNLFKLGER